jgi:hypothetical protein
LLEGNISLEPITALGNLIKRLIKKDSGIPGEKEPVLKGANLNEEDAEGEEYNFTFDRLVLSCYYGE